MILREALKIAEATAKFLEPHAVRIEIAGSIRRQRPECNDVDLVVIPKWNIATDLLGAVTFAENVVRTALVGYVRSGHAVWASGKEPEQDAQNLILKGTKCQLDVWIATPATWATRLITRTGSMQHNIWVAKRVEARGGKFKPYEGLILPGHGLVQPGTEAEFYRLLGLPFIEPHEREPAHLKYVEMEAACP